MSGASEIRTKMASINSTQKITRAMEMVAASKMRKAQERMHIGRPYAEHIRQVVGHVAHANAEYQHAFMVARAIKRVGLIVVATDRGLCGGLNSNLFKQVVANIRHWQQQSVAVDLCAIGNKAVSFFRNYGGNVVSTMTQLGDQPNVADLIGGVKVMLDRYEEQAIDRLFILYNLFVNTMTQSPQTLQLLPLTPDEDSASFKKPWDYLYEPDAKRLLDGLLIRYIESQVFQAVMENHACEQAARRVAMKSAADNAGHLIDDLQLIYNKARQTAITQELSEIVSGAAAV